MATEVLKNDIRAIQGGIRELVSVASGKLSVPSWKFPSKQAADVDIEEVLKNYASMVGVATNTGDGGDDEQKQRSYLLELIVDRYMHT